jgi:hypothetical protein
MSSEEVRQETPHIAASLSFEYPQFTRVSPPQRSSAESAWIGEIQPFSSDESARAFLHDIEKGREIFVAGGRIRPAPPTESHWADPLLVGMTSECKLLVLKLPSPSHPRAYLLRPLFQEHYSVVHPHPRHDQQIEWDNKKIPGLCIYSESEFRYSPDRDRNSQFLDQVVLYVARHLIWLRTRQLLRGFPPKGNLMRSLRPGELLVDDRPRVVRRGDTSQKPLLDYWCGYWAGPAFDSVNRSD